MLWLVLFDSTQDYFPFARYRRLADMSIESLPITGMFISFLRPEFVDIDSGDFGRREWQNDARIRRLLNGHIYCYI
jgi:hypothetical protein